MNLTAFSIKRPVTTVMIFAGLLILGGISLSRLPLELFPPITYPQLTVVTSYPNAAPEEVENLVTKLVEESVGTVKRVRRISSTSQEGLSIVSAEFGWGTNMDFAALGIREKIDLIKERLPRDAAEPIVIKFNPFVLPIMVLSVTGKSSAELLDISKRVIKDRLEKIDGVASAKISGGLEREILVEIDRAGLQSKSIDIVKVVEALRDSNLNYPAGTTKERFYEYLIRTIGEFKAVSEIKETIVDVDKREEAWNRERAWGGFEDDVKLKEKQDTPISMRRPIFLRDFAVIKDTFRERRSFSRYNGKENVSISIQKQAEANTIKTAESVQKTLEGMDDLLPSGIKIAVIYDQSTFIKNSINGLKRDALIGGGLAFLVLLFFLRNILSSAIVTLTIPVSIMIAFVFMFFSNISINLMSLGGLALGVGMLVDNGIVVIESIFRKRRTLDNRSSAVEGTNEVASAIFSSTLTTVAVFLPMVYVIGVAGQLFRELAFTITFSLVASLFAALSLIPLLSSYKRGEGRGERGETRDEISGEGANLSIGFVSRLYIRALRTFLKYKGFFLFLTSCIFIAALALLGRLDREFLPKVDQGQFIMKVDLRTGTKLEITDRAVRRIENLVLTLPELKDLSVNVGSEKEKAQEGYVETLGSHQAQIIINLKKERERSTQEVIKYIKGALEEFDLKGGEVEFVLQESVFQGGMKKQAPVVVEIKGRNLPLLKKISMDASSALKKIKGLYSIKSDLAKSAPETKVIINKDRAAQYNLSVRDIAVASQVAIKGYVATKFKEEGREIDIRVRLSKKDRADFQRLRNIAIRSPLDIMVPLKEVAYLVKGRGPSEIKRLDQQKVVFITANIMERSFKEISSEIQGLLKTIAKRFPSDYSVILAGESEQLTESFDSLRFALILAIVLVYMIMAGQFESLWQPFVIMFTLPLSVVGVAAALYLTKTSLNVISLLGVIMLGGIVVNNGIVLISYLNILRTKGVRLKDAVIEAGRTRLRPILMTTATTVLGLMPLAFGLGEGSELRRPMAIAVMGGLITSTFLTLFVLPALYTIVASRLPGRNNRHKDTETKDEG